MGFQARLRVAVVIGVALLAVAGPALGAGGGVTMSGLSYSPRTITIDAGDVVTWTNRDGRNQHSVTAHKGEFDSSPNCPGICLHDGDSYSVSFSHPGTYTYFCRVHGSASNPNCSMCGAVVVRGPGGPAPTSQPTTRPVTTSRAAASVPTSAPATATPSATPTASATPKPSASPNVASPLAAPPATESKGRGALVGVIIAGLLLDAGAVFVYRRRRAGA
jgi:plastocyanin